MNDLAGFGIGGYRSFGNEGTVSRFGPFSKAHVVVGRNNVGKSNVLHFAHDVLAALKSTANVQIAEGVLYAAPLDLPQTWNSSAPRTISLGLRKTDDVIRQLRADQEDAQRLFGTQAFSLGSNDQIWIDLDYSNGSLALSDRQLDAAAQEVPDLATFGSVAALFSNATSSDRRPNTEVMLRAWAPWSFIPDMAWLAAVRQITASGDTSFANGTGLVKELGRLQSPNFATLRADKQTFASLTSFVQYVLDDPTASIQVPDDKTTILVNFDSDKTMPLENLGTGLGEVILIAAVASTASQKLICVEEPEVHLHPTLQRKLLDYLVTVTDNHYLISTHSAQFLDAAQASISHVQMVDGVSKVEPVLSTSKLSYVVTDLGNRPSDLVQSNFIIWVEGPSDRIYVRAWLSLVDPELVEGAHYTVMFYGGKLLNHLSADDEETTDFIKLLHINRRLALVIDSDRKAETNEINATKKRVVAELDANESIAWVTEGYTIENYIPGDLLSEAIRQKYPSRDYHVPSDRFANPLGQPFKGSSTFPSKIIIAREVVETMKDKAQLGEHLEGHLERLGQAIRDANGMPAREA